MISPKPTNNALKSSALLSNTSGRTRSRPLFDKRSLSTLAHSPSALLPSATAISVHLRPCLQENLFHLKDGQGRCVYASVEETNDAQYHDTQTLSSTTTVDSPILSSLAASTNGRSLDPTYYNVAYGSPTPSATHGSEAPPSNIDSDHVNPSDVMDMLQLLEATLPQFQLPAAFYELDTYPNVDASENTPGSPAEEDVSACNAEALLDFMLQPLEESGLFSMLPEMSPETMDLSDAVTSYEAEVYRTDSDLALEQLQKLSLSTTTHSPAQSTKRKRDSSACDLEEETRMKRSRALSEDNYDFPGEIPSINPSGPFLFSSATLERKRPLPSSDEDDDMSTRSQKMPCSESDHEYDFLAEALLSSTLQYSPPTESILFSGLDSTLLSDQQDSDYDVPASQSVMSASDLLMSHKAGSSGSEAPASNIDDDFVDPFDVIDVLQLFEITFPQFPPPAAFNEPDTYPNVDGIECIPGSPTEDDVSACNTETLLDFMLQPLEESGLFSMSPSMSPETTDLSDAVASFDVEACRTDSDLALEQLQKLSLSTTTHSPTQSTKRKRYSSACDLEEETRMKRSRALSEDNYEFPGEIPNSTPSTPTALSHVPIERKRPLPSFDGDDESITPSPKRPRLESDHEYDFLAKALLTSTPPYSPPTEPQFFAAFDSTVSDEVDQQDFEYDLSTSRSEMSATDLMMGYEAGAYLYPSGFVVSPPSMSRLSDLSSLGVLCDLPSFSVYREAVPMIQNNHDILGVYPARNFDECSDEVLNKDDDDYIVNMLAIAFSSKLKLRLEDCSVCRAIMAPFCRCKLDTEIESLCTNCNSLLLPYCACLTYLVHTLPRPRKGMEPPHCAPYSRVDRTLWHAPFLPVMDVDSGLSVKEMAMLDLSVHNTTIDSDIRRRRRKTWRSWKFGWIWNMIAQSRSLGRLASFAL